MPASASNGRPPISLAQRRTPKRSEVIARDLASYIVEHELAPGTPLPPEHEMIESLGVGRTTLREALRLLETRGVLTIKSGPGGGPIVRRPHPSDLSEALTLILQFEGAALLDVVEARRWLESSVSRLAATLITEEQVQELRAINQSLLDDAQDQERVLEQNVLFHSRIGDACGNVVLRVFLETIISVADGRAVGVSYGRKQVEGIFEAHERVIDALANADPAAAGAAMNAHLEESQRYWRRRYGNAVKQPVHWAL
ncbi:MAG: GntR domain protein [Conexibacter sp.]|nr:GntR domain protein [Conexibacter sp.]